MNHLFFPKNKCCHGQNLIAGSIFISSVDVVKENIKNKCICILMFLLMILPFKSDAQNKQSAIPKDTLIKAAREIITSNLYCALVTMDSTGLPQVRTMNPFPLGDEIVIWFATSRKSKKITEIKNNPNVCVYFSDHNRAKGYVSISGTAIIIDDKDLLVKMKRDYWKGIPNWQNIFVLLKITPKSMDVINYQRGINVEKETNRSPTVNF